MAGRRFIGALSVSYRRRFGVLSVQNAPPFGALLGSRRLLQNDACGSGIPPAPRGPPTGGPLGSLDELGFLAFWQLR